MLRTIVCIMVLALAHPAQSANWYVAFNGSDNNPGTAVGPFRSWQKAVDSAQPGDTILIQPGTYRVSNTEGYGTRIRKSGTSAKPITLRGNGGRAILDCAGVSSDTVYCLSMKDSSWWKLSNIDVRGAVQSTAGAWVIGIDITNSSNNTFDQVASYRHQGPGFSIMGRSSNNTVRNSDFYQNYDPRTSPRGGNADGMQISTVPQGYTGNRIINCRSWSNSDDGFDLWQTEAPVYIDGSWAFWNGYVPQTSTRAGDGNGFKLGRNTTGPQHVVIRNLAFENASNGFDSNAGGGAMKIYHNTAYDNGSSSFVFSSPADGRHILKNNIGYRAGSGNSFARGVQQQTNAWNLPINITDSDFSGVSSEGVDGPRQSNGGLPILAFLRPNSSDLINRATKVGCCAPNIGALSPLNSLAQGR